MHRAVHTLLVALQTQRVAVVVSAETVTGLPKH